MNVFITNRFLSISIDAKRLNDHRDNLLRQTLYQPASTMTRKNEAIDINVSWLALLFV